MRIYAIFHMLYISILLVLMFLPSLAPICHVLSSLKSRWQSLPELLSQLASICPLFDFPPCWGIISTHMIVVLIASSSSWRERKHAHINTQILFNIPLLPYSRPLVPKTILYGVHPFSGAQIFVKPLKFKVNVNHMWILCQIHCGAAWRQNDNLVMVQILACFALGWWPCTTYLRTTLRILHCST